MADLIRRPKIGLALGGGGARGLAHIGVLEVFEREGVPIDIMAGTSMGGIITALYACGYSPERMQEIALELGDIRNLLRFLELAPPERGIIRTDRIRAYLAELIGKDRCIEDLTLPIALTCVDLYSKKTVYLTKGNLVEACMATSAVPGLFPPVPFNGYLLVDGGVLDNVPAKALRLLGAEYLIAVDVNHLLSEKHSQWSDLPKEATIRKFLPAFALDFYQAEIIMISTLTNLNLKEAKTNLVIRPAIPSDVNIFFGFTHALDTIQHGVHAAEQVIGKIKTETRPKLRFFG
ncbi:MAG: patatin-like phospholipase family protein [Anaerolineales bacterium]|nr:patatin-like phospholipase family protein [Anaerolineales bacterium]MCS7247260.1 patatin-like phospholipase family protein [Anaerolineales bacterium]MDW8161071.1 patatin-like phospholipase family protein [Anaerolineales bacterium]MDW8447582.1 patatin-like phospholipase family protein [Anaerolineales bacterium]